MKGSVASFAVLGAAVLQAGPAHASSAGDDPAAAPVVPPGYDVPRTAWGDPDDPDTFAAPWTVALEWTRDDGYAIYEYACHERNTVREAITSARALRKEALGR